MSSGNPFATTPGAAKGADPFGATSPAPQQVNGTEVPGQGVDAAPAEVIDPNDPLLTSEALTIGEGDAFAAPPPPPDAKWRVKLKHEGVKQEGSTEVLPWVPVIQRDRAGNKIGMYARTVMSVTIQDPTGKYDGYHLQVPFFYMDTKANKDGVSRVSTVLGLLKKPDGTPWIKAGDKFPNQRALMELFIQALQSEPEVGAESTWEVTCDVCAAKAKASGGFAKSIQGMTKFQGSKTVRGQYDPDFACMVDRGHGYSRARATATRFFSEKDLPKAA